MKSGLFDVFPFNLSLDVFYGDETEAKSIHIDSLENAIESLNEKERTAISLRYRDGLTLEEVGDRFGVCRERARQIIKTSVNALRKQNKVSLFKAVPLQEKILLEEKINVLTFERDALYKSSDSSGDSETILRTAKANAVYEKLLDMDIMRLNIPNGLKSFMVEADISKVRQLIDMGDITKIKRIGPYHANIVTQALREKGFP